MVTVVTISAPSSSDVGEWFNISGIVYESTTGEPISGALVNIYYDGKSLGSATTGVDGDYLDSVKINETGYFELKAYVGNDKASRYITITEPEPEPDPPVITTVTISAPSSAEKNTLFTISGTVKDQYGVGVAGASVALYDNGSYFATVSTNSAGGYSKSTSISSTGIHELAAVSGGKSAWTDITITTPEEPEPPIISNVTINAPASHVEDSPFTISGRVTDQYGDGVGGVTVYIYVNGSQVTVDTPDSQGYYSLNLTITSPGVYELGAVSGTKSAYRTITITEAPAEPPVITSVSIDAPANADAGVSFTVSGYVLDQYGEGMDGKTVYLYDNGSYYATVTTNSSGYYSKSTSISLAGVHELAAKADTKWAYRDITIIAPGPPAGEVTIKIVTTEFDPYMRYHGKAVDQSLDSNFWDTQEDNIIGTTGAGFTHTQTVTVAEGSHYVIYGNSGDDRWPWHTKIFVNGTLIAEGDVHRGSQLRGDFTAGAPPPAGTPTTLTLSAPDKAGVGEKFNISGILYETESGIPIPNQPINHSYDGRSLGGSTTGVDGDYLKEISVPEVGTWTIKSEFPGTEALQTSSSLANAVVAATPIATALLISGPIATGLALILYGSI